MSQIFDVYSVKELRKVGFTSQLANVVLSQEEVHGISFRVEVKACAPAKGSLIQTELKW